MFLHGCSDHQEQLFCLFELKKPPWPYTNGVSVIKDIFDGYQLHVVSSVVSRGQELFCGCSRFRFGVRVIYGTLNRSFKRRFVCPMYCKLQRLH